MILPQGSKPAGGYYSEWKMSAPSKAQTVQPVKVWSEERLATTSVGNSA